MIFSQSNTKEKIMELEEKAKSYLEEGLAEVRERKKEIEDMRDGKEISFGWTPEEFENSVNELQSAINITESNKSTYAAFQLKYKDNEKIRLKIAKDWLNFCQNWANQIKLKKDLKEIGIDKFMEMSEKYKAEMGRIVEKFKKYI